MKKINKSAKVKIAEAKVRIARRELAEAKKELRESEAYLDKLKDFERVAQRNSFRIEYDPNLVLKVKDNTGASHTITFSEDDTFVKLDGKTLPSAIPDFEDGSIVEEQNFFEGAGYQVLLTFSRYFLGDIFVLKTRMSEKVSRKGLKESVPDFSGCSHFYRFGDVVELAQTNPAAFGELSTFLNEVEGAEDLLNKPGYADAFVECPDSEDIAPNTIQVWYLDDILDTTDATAKFLLPDDYFGFFCDRCALLSFWDYLTILYEEVGADLSLESYGWETVNTDVFQHVNDSNSVHSKHVNDYVNKGNDTFVPDDPATIEIAGHTIDLDQDPSSDVVVFDGVVAEYDEREELIGAENNVLYATVDGDTYTIILFYRRHGLLADVAVLEPSLTSILKNKLV